MPYRDQANQPAVIAACVAAGQGMLVALAPLILARLPVSIGGLGAAIAAGTIALMIAAPLWARLAGRVGLCRTLPSALTAYVLVQCAFVAFVLLAIAAPPGPAVVLTGLCLLRVLHGAAAAGIHPGCQLWATANTRSEDTLPALARVSAGANLGRGLGPAAVLLLLPLGEAAALLGLALVPAAALAMLFRYPPPGDVAASTAVARPATIGRRLLICMGLAAASAVVVGQTQYLLGPLLAWRDVLGSIDLASHTGPVAALLALATAVAVIIQLSLGRRARRPGRTLALGVGLLWLASLSLQWASSLPALTVSLCGLAAGMALIAPACLALALTGQSGADRAAVTGWFAVAYTGGYSVAFATAGIGFAVWAWLPLPGVLLAAAAAGLCACLLAIVFSCDRRAVRAGHTLFSTGTSKP